MNVLLMGAGASKAYEQSKSKIKMPIAKDFFQTYNKLEVSKKPDVLVGDLINYLKKYHKMKTPDFINYSEDIENIHSEISDKVISYAKENKHFFDGNNLDEKILATRAYMQVLFLFNSVINEIQNGDISKPHQNIARNLKPDDVILTFNWDTLMDRSLESVTNWKVDSGYYVTPKAIYNGEWISVNGDSVNSAPLLIKLHGSTNWLTSYMRIEDCAWKLTQELSPDVFYVYRNTLNPYNTFKGRYWGGYEPYSYGYYPPNIPDKGEKEPEGYVMVGLSPKIDPRIQNNISGSNDLVSMPVIIPPIKQKEYSLFGDLFGKLWKKAEESLVKANNIVIIGYSFPKTDYRTDELFKKAFCQRSTKPKIVIINPEPDQIKQRFMYDYGIDEELIQVEKTYFDESFNIASVLSK